MSHFHIERMATMAEQSYLEQLEEARKVRNFKAPEIDYVSRFNGWEFKKSTKGHDMFVLTFKPIHCEDADTLDLLQTKNRQFKDHFAIIPGMQFNPFDNLLDFIQKAGGDLSQCSPKDKAYSGIKKILGGFDINPPMFNHSLKYQADGDRYNMRYREFLTASEVQTLIGSVAPVAQVPVEETVVPVAPVVAETIPTPPVAAPVAGPSYEQLIGAGWTDETLKGTEFEGLIPVQEVPTAPVVEEVVPTPPPATTEAAPVAPGGPKRPY